MTNTRPFHVLYVTHASNLTGASRSLLDLLSALERTRVKPIVLLREHGPLESKLNELGIPYEIIPYGLSVMSPNSRIPSSVKKVVNALAVARVRWLLNARKIDLVHNNSLLIDVGMRAALASEIPYVCHVRELVNEDHEMTFINEPRTKRLISRSAMNIFISQFVANKFTDWAGVAPRTVMMNAVSIPGGAAPRSSKPFLRGPFRLFLPGRFARGKGQLDAIRAAKLIMEHGYEIQLVLAGDVGQDDYYEECLNYINHNHMSCVSVRNFLPDVSKEYASADAALMCSSAEAMGRVTVEGMLAGALVIGANAGATPELIKDGVTGLLYKNGDPEALAEKIIWAISNAEAAVAIARAGRKYASEKFNKNAYASKMMKIYRGCLEVPGW